MQEIIILAIVYYTSTLIVEQMVGLFGEFLDQSDEIGLIVYIFGSFLSLLYTALIYVGGLIIFIKMISLLIVNNILF